jgi:hypothetical protein
MGLLGIAFGLVLLIGLAFRSWSVLLLAPAAALPEGDRIRQGAPRRLRARLRGSVRQARGSPRPTNRNLIAAPLWSADHTTIAMHDQPARKPLSSSVNRVSRIARTIGIMHGGLHRRGTPPCSTAGIIDCPPMPPLQEFAWIATTSRFHVGWQSSQTHSGRGYRRSCYPWERPATFRPAVDTGRSPQRPIDGQTEYGVFCKSSG